MSLSEEDYAAIADGMDALIESAKGFRAKMIEAGFSASAAEDGAVQFLALLLRATPAGGSS